MARGEVRPRGDNGDLQLALFPGFELERAFAESGAVQAGARGPSALSRSSRMRRAG